MPFISYAQNYEDVILWRALRDLEKGFYVDVGAADPEEYSVTCAFYERGWSGINVEPIDEYFDKLTQARTRDKNLKVAVGRETQVRTFYTFPSGWSTLDPRIAARHEAAGLSTREMVVPVLTLTKILEDYAPPTIHFLKVDVEGAETEVLEGLDLERWRPWIVVIEATVPNSTVSIRDKWEHLITNRRYGFAYFDGLNCFYVADEVSELKERLAVPPNVFDDFVRSTEWSSGQKAATLEQGLARARAQEEALSAQSANLSNALQAEQAQTANLSNALRTQETQVANLHSALQAEQAQVANLHSALQAEQAQVANLHNIVQAEQAHAGHLLARTHRFEAELAVRSHYRGVFGAARETGDRITGGGLRSLGKRIRGQGDRITGGGLRSLAKRALGTLVRWSMRHRELVVVGRAVLKPFPKLTTGLYRVATTPDAVAIPSFSSSRGASPPVASATSSAPSNSNEQLATLPASARSIYQRLQAALSDSNVWNQNR